MIRFILTGLACVVIGMALGQILTGGIQWP